MAQSDTFGLLPAPPRPPTEFPWVNASAIVPGLDAGRYPEDDDEDDDEMRLARKRLSKYYALENTFLNLDTRNTFPDELTQLSAADLGDAVYLWKREGVSKIVDPEDDKAFGQLLKEAQDEKVREEAAKDGGKKKKSKRKRTKRKRTKRKRTKRKRTKRRRTRRH